MYSLGHAGVHTLSIAFQYLLLNSARIGHATQVALFISVQLSSDAVSALQEVWVLTGMRERVFGTNKIVEATQCQNTRVNTRRIHPSLEKFRLCSNNFGFICDGVSNVGAYERNT